MSLHDYDPHSRLVGLCKTREIGGTTCNFLGFELLTLTLNVYYVL